MTELTVGLIKANVYALFMAVPLMIVLLAAFIYFNRNREISFSRSSLPLGMVAFLIILIILFVVHELIHGLTWGIFAEDHFINIEFGFIKETLTPYCTCSVPLKKAVYPRDIDAAHHARDDPGSDLGLHRVADAAGDWVCHDHCSGR